MTAAQDAECSIVGGCMIDAKAYWQVADMIAADDFADGRNRQLWLAISARARTQSDIDFITIGDDLPRLAGYATEVACATHSTANIRGYAEVVVRASTHRRVVAAGQAIIKLGPADALGEAQRALAAVAKPELASIKTAKTVLGEFVMDLQAKCDSESSITGLPTGYHLLDEMTSGFHPGDLIIVAGRPAMGKSTFVQNVGENVVAPLGDDGIRYSSGKRVLIFTQEMTAANFLGRSVASMGRIPWKSLRSPKLLEPEHWARVQAASNLIKDCGLLFDESCGITTQQIGARARQCHAQEPLAMIGIDYLQFIKLPKASTVAEAIQIVTRELKQLAKELGVPVVLLSQLNRDLEKRANKRPLMSDLRDSGAIEQDADLVLFMYRDSYYDQNSPLKGFAELIVGKQRNGETGIVPLHDRLDQTRFEDCYDSLPSVSVGTTRGFGSLGKKVRGKDAAQGG